MKIQEIADKNNRILKMKENANALYQDNNFYELSLKFELIFPEEDRKSREVECILNLFNVPYKRVSRTNSRKTTSSNSRD